MLDAEREGNIFARFLLFLSDSRIARLKPHHRPAD